MALFDWQPRTRVLFGAGTFGELGARARELGSHHVLLVCDRGIVDCGYADAAHASLDKADLRVSTFHDFAVNPDSAMIEAGRQAAAALGREVPIDVIVALGGGSSLDCAKGINLLLTNGGTMADYRGYGKAAQPMLPMIGVPTTAGTGSEAQSYAVIADAETHLKMACGDPKLAFRLAILDPTLTWSQPTAVTVATGFDALSHAVESFVTARRSPLSDMLAREAWRLIDAHLERVIARPDDGDARAAMLLGAHYAGAAIEQSMLGAAHACANPLTARYDITHGIAVALMLPSVVRWNAAVVGGRYAELLAASVSHNGHGAGTHEPRAREDVARDETGEPIVTSGAAGASDAAATWIASAGTETSGGGASPVRAGARDAAAATGAARVGDSAVAWIASAGTEAARGGRGGAAAEALAARLEQVRRTCGFPLSLRDAGVPEADLPALARDAAAQWTGGFNPRPLDDAGALELYRWAF